MPIPGAKKSCSKSGADNSEMLFQITSPHFCAGLIVERGKVTETAPILWFLKGQTIGYLTAYCTLKRFELVLVSA